MAAEVKTFLNGEKEHEKKIKALAADKNSYLNLDQKQAISLIQSHKKGLIGTVIFVSQGDISCK
ncbi:MAG: hypothetical protein ACXVNF_04100 [Neobacillus sp.]